MSGPVDLNRFADELQAAHACPQMQRCIRRYHGKLVVQVDLAGAKLSLDQLKSMIVEYPDPSQLTAFQCAAGEALFTKSVVDYCRALVSDGKGRFGTAVVFPADLAQSHRRIASFRNNRLSHYGHSADAREARWADDRAVLRLDDHAFKFQFASHRRGWDLSLMDDLTAVIAFALPVVTQQAKDQTAALLEAFRHAAGDPVARELFKRCAFNSREFFPDINQAEAMESGDVSLFDGVRVSNFMGPD
jgi:hypothetical protein